MLEALSAVWAAQEDAGERRHDALPDRRQARGWWRAGLGWGARPSGAVHLAGGGWRMGHGLRVEATRLNFSIPAPLNPVRKPLPLLARDLKAEPLAGMRETGSIAGKACPCSILALLLAII
jgi:hypothetical protein